MIRTRIAKALAEKYNLENPNYKVTTPEDKDLWTPIKNAAEKNKSGEGGREPIIIIGYSDGATKARLLAERLAKEYPNEKIDYIATIDLAREKTSGPPTSKTSVSMPSNIEQGDNYYQRNSSFIRGKTMSGTRTIHNHEIGMVSSDENSDHLHGPLVDRGLQAPAPDLERADHFNIVEDPAIQKQIADHAASAWARPEAHQ
jgi:hypothetical protein